MMLHHTLIEEIRHDYMEMMFHHILALALFYLLHMLNFTRLGFTVLFMHDLSDTFTQIVRCIVETTYERATVFFAYCMVFGWIYFRCVLFGYLLYSCLWSASPSTIFQGQDFKCIELISLMLSLLLVLNVYWLTLMVNALMRYKASGEIKDDRDGNKRKK